MTRPSKGDVHEGSLAPDGSRYLFLADAELDEVFDLFSVTPVGTEYVRLNPTHAAGRTVSSFRIVAAGAQVVFLNRAARQLWAAPLDGHAPAHPLIPILPAHASVTEYVTSPDGLHVVFVADAESDETYELYGARIDGSAPPWKLSPPLVAGGDVPVAIPELQSLNVRFTPDGGRVLFLADAFIDDVNELFSVPVVGGSALRLNRPLASGQSVIDFEVAPDSRRCVYRADQDMPTQFELFSARTDGAGEPRRIHAPLVAGGDVGLLDICLPHRCGEFLLPGRFRITPDSRSVVYVADAEVDEEFAYYLAPLAGSGGKFHTDRDVVRLGVSVDVERDFELTADGNTLVYRGAFSELFALRLDRRERVRLDHGEFPGVWRFWLDPTVARVVYLSGQGATYGLHVVPLDRGEEPRPLVSAPLIEFGADDVLFVPGSARLLFRRGHAGQRLHVLDLDSGAELELSGPMHPQAHLNSLALVPGADRVLYRSNARVASVDEAWSVALDGSALPALLHPAFPPGDLPLGTVAEFRIRADGELVVYRSDQDQDEVYELHSVALRPPYTRLQLHADFVPGVGIPAGGFELAPAGGRAAYLADDVHNDVFELYSVPSGGGAPPVRLNGPLVAGGDVVTGLRFSPDGTRLLFRADAEENERFELYSVPSDGSGPAVKLNHALMPGGDVVALDPAWDRPEVGYLFSPDGTRVVYRAYSAAGESTPEMFSVPSDGSGPAVKLNGTLLLDFFGVRNDFRISADSAWVVYRARQNSNGYLQLWRVPLDGSSAPVELNGPIAGTSGRIDSFVLTPDGTRALYAAQRDSTSSAYDLWVVPLDLGAAPVKLSGSMVVGGSVAPLHYPQAFEGTPDDLLRNGYCATSTGYCLFRANARRLEDFDLYRVPLDGSAAPVLLSGELDVARFALDESEAWVVLAGERNTRFELLGVPVDDPSSAVTLNVPGRRQLGILRRPAGGRVLYQADEDSDSLTDHLLYSAPIDGSGPAVRLDGGTAVSVPSSFHYQTTPDAGAVFLPSELRGGSGLNLYLARP